MVIVSSDNHLHAICVWLFCFNRVLLKITFLLFIIIYLLYNSFCPSTDCQSEFLFTCFGLFSVASYSSQVLMH